MRVDHRGWKIAGLLGFSAICISVFVYLYVAAGGKLRLDEPYTAKVTVPTAFQLVQNGDVRRAGVKVGVVRDITNVGDNGLVEIEIDDETAPLYRDATVKVRTKTLVGENYLDLNPGTPSAGALPDGATLPLERAAEAVQLDQILSALDADTRREVRRNLDELGPGLDGQGGALNRMWAAMRPTTKDGGTVMRVLAGQKREVSALVEQTGETMQAFGDRTEQVRTLARQAKATAEVAAGRDRAMRAAFRELDPTLRQVQGSVGRLGAFSGRATPVMARLADVTGDLHPVLRDLRPAVSATRTLFAELPGALKAADPLLAELRPFSRALEPMVGSLDAFLRQANPAVAYLSPFREELGSVFANNGRVFEQKDAIGNRGRVHAVLSYSSLTSFTPEMRKAIGILGSIGAFEVLDGEGENPYPKPGDTRDPQRFDGNVPRVEAGK